MPYKYEPDLIVLQYNLLIDTQCFCCVAPVWCQSKSGRVSVQWLSLPHVTTEFRLVFNLPVFMFQNIYIYIFYPHVKILYCGEHFVTEIVSSASEQSMIKCNISNSSRLESKPGPMLDIVLVQLWCSKSFNGLDSAVLSQIPSCYLRYYAVKVSRN